MRTKYCKVCGKIWVQSREQFVCPGCRANVFSVEISKDEEKQIKSGKTKLIEGKEIR